MTVLWKKFPHVPDVTAICFTLPGYQRVLLTPGAPCYRTQLSPPALATFPASRMHEEDGAREEDERMECFSDSVPQSLCCWLSLLLACLS